MRGRKPVPTVLKIARGNPSQHRIADDEPQPSTDIDLNVPKLLKGDRVAKAEWNEKAPMLHRLGLLTEADRDALIMYCATFARWQRAERHLRKEGEILISKRNKYPYPSPYLHIAKDALTQCRALLLEFGLTPVSRTRAHVGKKPPVDTQKDRFFGSSSSVTPA